MTIGREEVENLAGQNAEKRRQSESTWSSAWKSFEDGRRNGFTHTFRPFSYGQSRLHLGIPRGKTSTASRCLASVRSQEQDRHASLPLIQVVDRHVGPEGCAVSDTCPVETAADQVETDAAASCGESGSESSSAAEVSGFSMARKINEQETNRWVKWQRSSRHVRQKCSRQNPCHPARFVLDWQDYVLSGPMTYWQRPRCLWCCDCGKEAERSHGLSSGLQRQLSVKVRKPASRSNDLFLVNFVVKAVTVGELR